MSTIRRDEERGVHALYRDHHGWLQSWLRKKLGNSSDAADLAHDTFLRILSAWGSHDERELREPRAYVTTVAGRVLINHYRRLSLERAYLAALAAMPQALSPSAEDRAIVLETLHEIDAMLERMSPSTRTAFLLARLNGLSHAEIAERLLVSVRTVKRYLVAAYEECILLTL
ncbi:RNA polymerase sigma factor [Caballeronia sordidicola]|uniref:RNA polymerase sigma factor n=1 Tax=Caballeronia sordidicola TaxID=196367 RepID=A0A158FUY9_CABSO|nr:sigma-70 family RNA polymerase sigma factor [Caballeronia sordidicola]SAL23645.1 RNA polymerase sigma factor [Caballeronia sordidicola]